MKKESCKKVVKTASLVGAGALLVGATIGGAIMYDASPAPQIIEKNNTVVKEVPFEVVKEVVVEKPVEVVKEVKVGHEDLKLVVDYLVDTGVFDDKGDVIPEIKGLYNARSKVLEMLSDDDFVLDYLEDEGFISDEDDAKVLRIYKDLEDIEVVNSDFDDEEYEFLIKVKVEDEDEDEKFKLLFRVLFENGEAEIEEVFPEEE